MAKARYYKTDGKKGRARELPAALFDGVVNEAVLHQVVKAHLANQRQGTAAGEEPLRRRGRKPEALAAEGDRTRPAGNDRAPQWWAVAGPSPRSRTPGGKVPEEGEGARPTSASTLGPRDRVVLIDALGSRKPEDRDVW
jgi:hypothetical protein